MLVQVFPLDAGTDNGFTFTSPNWETEPRAEVFTIFTMLTIINITTVDISLTRITSANYVKRKIGFNVKNIRCSPSATTSRPTQQARSITQL